MPIRDDAPPPAASTAPDKNTEMIRRIEEAQRQEKRQERAIPDEPPDDPVPPDDRPKPAAHASVDALLAAVEKADTIEIMDQWNGLGASYDMFIRLDRSGDEVTYRAKIGRFGRVGERLADPTEPRREHHERCLCPVEDHCKCELDYVRKTGKTPFSTIQPFLHRLSRKRVDRQQNHPTGNEHTDDYPRVHVVVSGRALAAPLHLAIRDNRRHWRANGFFIAPDPPPPPEETVVAIIGPVGTPPRQEKQTIVRTDKHERVNGSFDRVLALLGAREWRVDAVEQGRSGHRGAR